MPFRGADGTATIVCRPRPSSHLNPADPVGRLRSASLP